MSEWLAIFATLQEAQSATRFFDQVFSLGKAKSLINGILDRLKSIQNNYGKHLPTVHNLMIQQFLTPIERKRMPEVCFNWLEASRCKKRYPLLGVENIKGLTRVAKKRHHFLVHKISVFRNLFYSGGHFYRYNGEEEQKKNFSLNIREFRTTEKYIAEKDWTTESNIPICILDNQFQIVHRFLAGIFDDFAICDSNNSCYVLCNTTVSQYNFAGELMNQWQTKITNFSALRKIYIAQKKGLIFLAYNSFIQSFNLEGEEQQMWQLFPSLATDICFSETHIYVRKVHKLDIYDLRGNLAWKGDLVQHDSLSRMFFVHGHICDFSRRTLRSYHVDLQ